MSNLSDDLDRFLKTDGIRILIESGTVRTEPYEPLTEDDIENFDATTIRLISKKRNKN